MNCGARRLCDLARIVRFLGATDRSQAIRFESTRLDWVTPTPTAHCRLLSSNNEPTTVNTGKPRNQLVDILGLLSASLPTVSLWASWESFGSPFFCRRALGATTLRSLRRRSRFCCSSDHVPQPLPQTGTSRSKAKIAACGEENHFDPIEETLRSHSGC